MPIGSSRAPIWRPKSVPSPPATINFTLIRWEGWPSSGGGTPGNASSNVYEIYIFTNGYVEMRVGYWALTAGVTGHYTSAGTGVAFPSYLGNPPMVDSVCYVWDASVTTPTVSVDATYVNGAIVNTSSSAPSLGRTAASWPPPTVGSSGSSGSAGWTVLQNAFADDAFVTVPIASTIIMGTSRTAAYVGSNVYITFGAGSIVYSPLSTTYPALDKFMFNAADRGYMRVAYTTGSK
jgi:hypothetical protein